MRLSCIHNVTHSTSLEEQGSWRDLSRLYIAQLAEQRNRHRGRVIDSIPVVSFLSSRRMFQNIFFIHVALPILSAIALILDHFQLTTIGKGN